MTGSYLSVYTLSREDRERLDTDPAYALGAFERLLGPPVKNAPSRSGWVAFVCPNSGCDGHSKFGVKIAQGGRETGGFNCYRCGLKGKGFVTLCRMLGRDPGEFVDGQVSQPVKYRPPVREADPLDERNFAAVWKWVQQQAVAQYGPDSRGLSPEHRAMLESRGLTVAHLPPWFTVPGGEALQTAVQRWGPTLCERANLFKPDEGVRTGFFGEGRLALVYPNAPWLGSGTLFGRVRTYKPAPRTPREEKFKVLSPSGYVCANNVYVRAGPEMGMNAWLIAEGEVKPEASRQAGVPSLGLPGMNSSHAECAKIIRTALLQTNLLIPTSIVICLDTAQDERHQRYVESAAKSLTEAIREDVREHCDGYVIPVVRFHIPARPGDKADIDSWIGERQKEYGVAYARKCWREAVRNSLRQARH